MFNITEMLNKAAIGISLVCTVHCLLVPILLIAAPSAALLAPFDESVHRGLILLLLPTSLIGLALGCSQHRQWPIFFLGLAGLLVSIASVTVAHDILGETWEIVGTLSGAALICLSHVRSHRQCRADISDPAQDSP